jgi:hypothetical protein
MAPSFISAAPSPSSTSVQREQFAPGLAGGGDDRHVRRRRGKHPLQQRHPARARAAFAEVDPMAGRKRRARRFVQHLVLQAAFFHHQRERQAGAQHAVARFRHHGGQRLRLVREAAGGHFDEFEQIVRDAPHQLVLRLVVQAGLAAPGHDQQGRDAERGIERGQRIDGVAEPRVLAHDGRLQPRQPRAGGDGHRLALAGRADIAERPVAGGAVDQRGQEAARDTGVEAGADGPRGI